MAQFTEAKTKYIIKENKGKRYVFVDIKLIIKGDIEKV
jgi:hypothetical protein